MFSFIGLMLGVLIGVALDNIGVGIAIGLLIGSLIHLTIKKDLLPSKSKGWKRYLPHTFAFGVTLGAITAIIYLVRL